MDLVTATVGLSLALSYWVIIEGQLYFIGVSSFLSKYNDKMVSGG